ncbi:hypothetical protein DPMN_118733 [Dreissena polymorpha]|uniref:Uncharacterized protein n=1 Tax=Dreissena polymorpha TaxID=45954 RepID=A0A9D4JQI9_DREPO|nr:hypothetical protein DPMN_118733 [Dreissena polymorpha]
MLEWELHISIVSLGGMVFFFDTTENRLEHSELVICWEIRDKCVPDMIVARLLAVCLLRCALHSAQFANMAAF